MKARLLIFTVLVGAALCAVADDAAMAGKEAQMAAAALAKQNDALRAELVRMKEEVARLTLSLAQARAEVDEAMLARSGSQPADVAPVAGASSIVADGWKITEVNADLKLVVMDAGTASGLRRGMLLYALRSDKPVSRLRVVDVRERITGAVVEENFGAVRPEKGDRVVLMTQPK